jgi:hypothetical protein
LSSSKPHRYSPQIVLDTHTDSIKVADRLEITRAEMLGDRAELAGLANAVATLVLALLSVLCVR